VRESKVRSGRRRALRAHGATTGPNRPPRSIRASWVDVAWVGFVGLNLMAMRLIPQWQTIPFLIIWVSLTAIYGFRLWRLGSTIVTVAAVTLATGGLIGIQVLRGQEDVEYLVEVPLLAVMFVVMVWHARRRLAAMEEMRGVSEENLRLLDQQRRFLQDASHELRTPITVALGHAELIERTATDPLVAQDARVAVDELLRLRKLADRMLLLLSAEASSIEDGAPVEIEPLVVEALRRWGHVPRRWSPGELVDASVEGDHDRLAMALDALIENAVGHTDVDGVIELSAHPEGPNVVIAVADSGPGIAEADLERIFDRFARADSHRSREAGGFGLGLAIVKAIVEAHHGSVRVRSTTGGGAVFELILPKLAASVGAGLQARATPASTSS
jgi:signal transduction histidine kinase